MTGVVRAAALQGYVDLTRRLGAEPHQLLRRHGLRPHDLTEPDNPVPLTAVATLLEDTAAAAACPDFGLRLADEQTPEVLGPLAVVLMNSPTVDRAIADASRYLFVHSPEYEVVLDRTSPLFTGCASIRFEIRLGAGTPVRQLIDGCLGDAWRLTRVITQDRLRPIAVTMPHTPLAGTEVYQRFFGAPVHFGQPYSGLHFPKGSLDMDLVPIAPLLRQAALDHISIRAGPRTPSLSDRVAHALVTTMGAHRGTKGQIASLLTLHPRTLQRRLHDEGTTFEAVRDEVYRRAASRFLGETDIPLAQVAGALGYSEQSALTRACRRWFSATPKQMREDTGPRLSYT
ncbi:AraC family transcriptional regulator [Streptomyces samsunensis]|uniref:AraC family transcriptional regulator n=1 Tax=Streptomyces malaysiensis TaxID=92644 RepID=UPI001582B9CC|nr:AraC family transcriptional regulator [Streptomyces samsunensis]NUH40139.1 AraC family transcriptional regulator [Streptomyces samsunensis]